MGSKILKLNIIWALLWQKKKTYHKLTPNNLKHWSITEESLFCVKYSEWLNFPSYLLDELIGCSLWAPTLTVRPVRLIRELREKCNHLWQGNTLFIIIHITLLYKSLGKYLCFVRSYCEVPGVSYVWKIEKYILKNKCLSFWRCKTLFWSTKVVSLKVFFTWLLFPQNL